ncbi:DksA/TraR family C4-type zinc finger protein [Rosenbergiella australiborealis]|uniref:DksA/TraR family C4-type zinc finger protein n=1 Tax=Rosenbergiella australiborealis TaxID=1544696 RepID=A0ABS5T5L3_9GAMM|nr:DksA/TraR family C4-type zinc finger protein [Rosenbergiella australiborealis]MBT0727626.1 DksA/TraR family C4-type zinc finger protein [Rosenbergiella australiborealis]
MAGGWVEDGSVQKQIDDTVDDAIAQARSQLHQGESAEYCAECGEPIPEARQYALPGVIYCIHCQQKVDKKYRATSAINRRGSKDSQLR